MVAPANFFFPSQTILEVDHTQSRVVGDILHLQRRIAAKQDRQDYLLRGKEVALKFRPREEGGVVAILDGREVLLSKSAWTQLGQYLEASGLTKTLEATIKLAPNEQALFAACQTVVNAWLQRTAKRLRWRVVNRRVEDKVVAVLDGIVSDTYAPFSHVEALEVVAKFFGEDQSVINYRLTTTEMRLRLAEEPMVLNKAVKMIEVFNSENGHRSLSFWGRLWKLICSNGMAATLEDYGHSRNNHVGRMRQRVEETLPEQLVHIRRATYEGQEIREQAANVRLAWEGETVPTEGVVEAFIKTENENRARKMTAPMMQAVIDVGIPDETSGEYGTLAHVENAVTRAAQEMDDMRAQRLLEDIGLDLLQRGLRQRDGDLIHVRPLERVA